MQAFYGKKGVPYYSLLNNGVRFNEYVGVIQIGKMTIEVLPKADNDDSGEAEWRGVLIDMLRSVGIFKIHAPTSAALRVKPNSILDLYIELFIQEAEQLLRAGLIKKYRKKDSNCGALKGNLLFAQHIQKNLVDKTHFFTRHTVYDVHHHLHRILYKTLLLLDRINTNVALRSRIGVLLLDFPPQEDLNVFDATFEKLVFDRKTEPYRKSIEIARLLLLNYHPNVNSGNNHLLTLMFDMNKLWERFVFTSLREYFSMDNLYSVTGQTSKYFWKPLGGVRSSIRPDIVIQPGSGDACCIVLDTKWKNLNGYNPSPDDLRQLYVYHEFYNAKKVALVYPGKFKPVKGTYYTRDEKPGEKECSVMGIRVLTIIRDWKTEIGKNILSWAGSD